MKTKIVAIGLAVLFAMSVLAIGTTPVKASDLPNPTPMITYHYQNVVKIDNNTGFNATNGFSGTGTIGDPYLFTHHIVINDTWNGYNMWIANTTSYFSIVSSSINAGASGGIYLRNVTHATITWTNINNTGYGIFSDHGSNDIRISGNNITNCSVGVGGTGTHDVLVQDNVIDHENGGTKAGVFYQGVGTSLYNGTGNITIQNNTFTDWNSAIYIHDLTNITDDDIWIIDNQVQGTPGNLIKYGVFVDTLTSTATVRMANNTFNDIDTTAIDIINAMPNSIIPIIDTVIDNTTNGIHIQNSENVLIINPTVSGAIENATILDGVFGVDLRNGIYNENYNDIYITGCIDVNITDGAFVNTTFDAIYAGLSDDIVSWDCVFDGVDGCFDVSQSIIHIYNPTANNCSVVVYVTDDSEVDIENMYVWGCSYGIYASDSIIYVVYGNISNVFQAVNFHNVSGIVGGLNISKTTAYGIYIEDSLGGALINNSFIDCGLDGIYITNTINYTICANYFYTATYGDAFDDGMVGDNQWYFNASVGGNYYCNYTGYDEDGDGFGDQPYAIKGGSNTDDYPLGKLNDVPAVTGMTDMIMALIPIMIVIMVIGMFLGFVKKMFNDLGKRK
jgi:nitrous oxidase accessory protein NosD